MYASGGRNKYGCMLVVEEQGCMYASGGGISVDVC